ncbi:sulfotransferase family protein [Parasphingopyxis algicola]|uniref:sulfotransferase n=1 Tax=Parasphingopyxis algicola TaxID=2026624 RepID=UPI0015A4D926|nr:sulfotransferase [Parasphingopyxis algicola]QLC24818.1 sulfotransferase family protein [Parasphingopyxis algicola]
MTGRVILILGMHRSGTSALAGTLQSAGLFLGDVIEASPHNRKGNRENKKVMLLNEEILTSNGGAWHRPPPRMEWQADHRARRDAIIADYRGRSPWGLKDPRLLLLLDGWRAALPDAEFVGTVRSPVAVARSLLKRNPEFGTSGAFVDLWHHYNERLFALWRRERFPLVDFDTDSDRYLDRLAAICERLGLDPARSDERFFEASLRTAQRNGTGAELVIPDRTRRLYRDLKEAASD